MTSMAALNRLLFLSVSLSDQASWETVPCFVKFFDQPKSQVIVHQALVIYKN